MTRDALAAAIRGQVLAAQSDARQQKHAAQLNQVAETRVSVIVAWAEAYAEAMAGLARVAEESAPLLAALRDVLWAHDSYMATIQDLVAAGKMREDPLGQACEAARAVIARAEQDAAARRRGADDGAF